jgi:hypothetical protein
VAEDLKEPAEIQPLFNSPLETGVRAIVVLEAFFPRAFDLIRLTWLDHLVVHTADLGGPASLHPDVPERTGELLVRRRLVENGLNLMRRLHLIEVLASQAGIQYRTSENATAFVDSMRSDYLQGLKERAFWLADRFAGLSDIEISEIVSNRLNRLTVEFQGDFGPEHPLA